MSKVNVVGVPTSRYEERNEGKGTQVVKVV